MHFSAEQSIKERPTSELHGINKNDSGEISPDSHLTDGEKQARESLAADTRDKNAEPDEVHGDSLVHLKTGCTHSAVLPAWPSMPSYCRHTLPRHLLNLKLISTMHKHTTVQQRNSPKHCSHPVITPSSIQMGSHSRCRSHPRCSKRRKWKGAPRSRQPGNLAGLGGSCLGAERSRTRWQVCRWSTCKRWQWRRGWQ